MADQHAWHLWHRTDAGRHVSPARLLPSMLRILQLPDTTAQLLPTTICLSQCVSLHACQSARGHLTPSVLCSLFYWKRRGEGRCGLKGDSTLKRGQTDGLCVGYLQPGGDWGNLAVVAEVLSQVSQAKAPQNVIKIKHKQCLREGFWADAHRKAVIFTLCHSVMQAIHLLSQFIIQVWPVSLIRPNWHFFFSFSLRDLGKEWTHRKDMFVLWWNASYLFLFVLTSLIATSCSRDATANQNLPLCLVTAFKHSSQATRGAKISTYSDLTLLQLQPTEKRLHPG